MSLLGLLFFCSESLADGLSVGAGTLGISLSYTNEMQEKLHIYTQGHYRPSLPKDANTLYNGSNEVDVPFKITRNQTGATMGLRYIPFLEFPEIQLMTGAMYNLGSNTSILDVDEGNNPIIDSTAITKFNLIQPFLGLTYANYTKFGLEYACLVGLFM